MKNIKKWIKYFLQFIPVHFTKNMEYDAQTKLIIQKICKPDSNCIDIGCHKGEIMDLFLQYAPEGKHVGFEPIPDMFSALEIKYKNTNCRVSPVALSNEKGSTTFQFVKSNPAYSGLQKRAYKNKDEVIEEISVQTDLLDHVIPETMPITMIKIDVEGGELLVLEGAVSTIKRTKPVIIFEHGLGASEFYQSTPEKVFALLTTCGLQINTLKGWLQQIPALSLQQFEQQYLQKTNYYFIAYPA
jgi:FkbM family methyltransferase